MKPPPVRFSDRQKRPVEGARLRRLLAFALAGRGSLAAVSLAVVDDAGIAELNRRFLRREGPTDVMAFPLDGDPDPEPELGEIVVSSDTAARQALELGHPFRREMDLLALHGLLHLLGMDDAVPAERAAMLRAAEEILAAFDHGGEEEKKSKKPAVDAQRTRPIRPLR